MDKSYIILQGWIECVGCADRACFDLQQHTNASGEKLVAMVDLPEPVSFTVTYFKQKMIS